VTDKQVGLPVLGKRALKLCSRLHGETLIVPTTRPGVTAATNCVMVPRALFDKLQWLGMQYLELTGQTKTE